MYFLFCMIPRTVSNCKVYRYYSSAFLSRAIKCMMVVVSSLNNCSENAIYYKLISQFIYTFHIQHYYYINPWNLICKNRTEQKKFYTNIDKLLSNWKCATINRSERLKSLILWRLNQNTMYFITLKKWVNL